MFFFCAIFLHSLDHWERFFANWKADIKNGTYTHTPVRPIRSVEHRTLSQHLHFAVEICWCESGALETNRSPSSSSSPNRVVLSRFSFAPTNGGSSGINLELIRDYIHKRTFMTMWTLIGLNFRWLAISIAACVRSCGKWHALGVSFLEDGWRKMKNCLTKQQKWNANAHNDTRKDPFYAQTMLQLFHRTERQINMPTSLLSTNSHTHTQSCRRRKLPTTKNVIKLRPAWTLTMLIIIIIIIIGTPCYFVLCLI